MICFNADMDAFNAYAICFGVGIIFTLVSAIGGHIFGGHGDAAHWDVDQGHAEAGFGAQDMPGFSPISPTTLASFLAAFGGFGMVFTRIESTRSPWVSVPLAAIAGVAIAGTVFWLFSTIFKHTQSSSEGRVSELIGQTATVITPVAPGAVGEIAYVQGGSRYSAPARTEQPTAIPSGTPVKITRIVGTQFYVTAV
jgi:membrane protein implicated in regulation of membrane protease activity